MIIMLTGRYICLPCQSHVGERERGRGGGGGGRNVLEENTLKCFFPRLKEVLK